MRKIIVTIIILLFAVNGFTDNWVDIHSSKAVPAKVSLVASTIDRSIIHITLDGFNLREVQTPQGTAYSVHVGQATPILGTGEPDLPKITASVVIPDQAGMGVRVVNARFRDYPDILVAPSKGVLLRDTDPSKIPYFFGAPYSKDHFYPGVIADTRQPHIIRDVRGQTMIAYLFQYNPVKRILRVYYDLTIELYQTAETGVNPLPQVRAKKFISQDFQPVLNHHFMNFNAADYPQLEETGNILVICYGPFMDAMKPYVNWKNAEGYHTEMISIDSIGDTSEQIRSFIQNYYETKGLTHVLLVGDGLQIPTNTGNDLGGPSDNAYGYVAGDDHYADLFIGRFSAENVAQVQTQVQRTLEYEQNPQFVSDSWFSTVIGIASNQGPGDDDEIDFEHVRNQQTQLKEHSFTANPELFDGSQGGNDAAGNPVPRTVATEVNKGASLILYTGHGSNTSWGTSGFSNGNVSQLDNAGKLPFIWSVACVNGNFTAGTCFAEAWLRASKLGQPTGAIAFLGSTINQSWNSPMEGQDEMTNILTQTDSNNIKHTFAGLSINGCMKMIDSYDTDGANMADTWTVFGDPAIMVRTAAPQPIMVQCDTLLHIGDSVLTVFCGVKGARVTLTRAGAILSTEVAGNDSVILSFPALADLTDTIHLVATAYNMIPYQKDLLLEGHPVAIVAGFTALPKSIVPGQSVAFADTSFGNTTTWTWHFPGGTPEVSHEKNPVITYDRVGNYDVKLVVGNGFSSDSAFSTGYIVVDFPTYTETAAISFEYNVLPNPGNGNFTVKIKSSRADVLDVNVYNMIGALVYTETAVIVAGQTTRSLNLTFLPDAVYFLKLSGKQLMETRKLIIRR